jgi:hypothetical protein
MRFKRPSPQFEIPAFGFIFVLLCYGSVRINFFSDMKPLPAWLAVGLFLVILFAVFFAPIFMIGLAVWRCFGQGSRLELIRLIGISYGTLIFVFAGIYLVMASAGDHDDAINKWYLYSLSAHPTVLRVEDQRAFRGIDTRLWTGPDWPVDASGQPIYDAQQSTELSIEDLRRAALSGRVESVVRFLPGSVLSVFAACLHFSIVTMSTVGYGDIVPAIWYARTASDLQILIGLSLVAVALARAFSRVEASTQN